MIFLYIYIYIYDVNRKIYENIRKHMKNNNITAHRGRSGVCDSKKYKCISCGLMFPLVRRRWHSPCHCRFFSHCLFLAPLTPHLPRHVAKGILLNHRWLLFNTIFKSVILRNSLVLKLLKAIITVLKAFLTLKHYKTAAVCTVSISKL